MVDGQRTHSTHIGSDNSAENTPNAPKIFGPKDQKFRIFEKKTLSEFVCFKFILQKPFVTMYGLLHVLKDRLCIQYSHVMLRYC